MRFIARLLVFSIMLVFFLQASTISKAGVIVEYFRASGMDKSVRVEWKTNTEIAINGFYVQRSLSRDTGYTRVSELIENQGVSPGGASYEYVDVNLENGTTYWYKLEIIDDEMASSFYGTPKSAVPDAQSTIVPTSSPAPPTQNPETSITPTTDSTTISTSTTQPTNLVPDTSTPISTIPLPTPSVDVTDVTATLIPLPTMTLIFPPTETIDQLELPDNNSSNTDNSSFQKWSGLFSTRLSSIIGISLIWLVFIVLVIYFLRRIQ